MTTMNASRDENAVVVSDHSSDEDSSSSDCSSDESYSSDEGIDEEVEVVTKADADAEEGKQEVKAEEGLQTVVSSDEDAEMVFEDSEYSEGSGISSSHSESPSDASELSSDQRRAKNEKSRSTTLAHGETTALRTLRMLLLLVLMSIMLLCTVGAYFFNLNKDISAFHAEFTNVGLEVISTFQEIGQQKLQALDSLSAVTTAYALDHNDKWPMVTMAHSAPLLERYLKLSGAASLTILPIVPPTLRAQWEVYSVKSQGWM